MPSPSNDHATTPATTVSLLNLDRPKPHNPEAEIAVLGAVGWTWKRIGALIFLEGLLLTALGGGGGILLGMALLRALASSTPLAGYMEPDTDGGLLALAFACLLVLGVLGSLLPALRAARLNVADGLRHE